MVSFASGVRMLVVWYRRKHPNEQPEIPRSFCRCCGTPETSSSHIPLSPLSDLGPRTQIDPNRTISAGKVDIGAFRTYPENYTPPNVGSSSDEYQSIPLSKIEDFGVHANQYYQLEVEIFKSSLDTELLGLLWNKYWVNTLSQSPLISVRPATMHSLVMLLTEMLCVESRVCCVSVDGFTSKTCEGASVRVHVSSVHSEPEREGKG